ncbi:MAG: heme acquisition protein HasA [Pseudomonas sp.]|nr:heme acquisition protein HasA [Pseudomonas sp.]
MTISVNYPADQGATSIQSYLNSWGSGFSTAGHGKANTGSFNKSNGLNPEGEQYGTKAKEGNYAFVAESNTDTGLHYQFKIFEPSTSNQNHYLWGNLDNIKLGEGLQGGKGTNFTLKQNEVSFNGLDLTAEYGAGRAGNPVHELVYGLMKGETTQLEARLNDLLDDYNLSTASTFDQVAAGLAAAPSTVPAALVGMAEFDDWAMVA